MPLESVGMWENRHKQIGHLRVAKSSVFVLRVSLLPDPDIFVLDEPTTKSGCRRQPIPSMNSYHSAHKHGKSVLMIATTQGSPREYTDRNIHLVRNQKRVALFQRP